MTPETRHWRHVAPLQMLLSTSLLLLLAVGLAAWCALHSPWLGLTLEPGEGGWDVASVHPEGPVQGRLRPGDTLSAIEAGDREVSLADRALINNPHKLPTFAEYSAHLRFEDRLYTMLTSDSVTLVLTDGQRLEVKPVESRPLGSLPLDFWLLHLFGLIAVLVGIAVWAFRPAKVAARLLALSGLGFFIATWQHSLWQVRELALPGWLFDTLLRVNHLGLHLMLGALAVLLAIYPQRLGRWTVRLIVVAVVAVQLNENLHWLDWPLHSFYLPLLLYYLTGVVLAVVQWRKARGSPLDRGALRWVFLSVLLAMGAGMASYFLPLLLGLPTLVDITTMVGLAVMLYIGFALGVLRYRLFELERWWFMAWAWFFGGLAVVLMDLAVVSLFGMDPTYALGLAVFLVGWVYFPMRQWLWRRLTTSVEVRMEHHLPAFVQALYTEAESRLEQVWQDLLQRIFQPLALESVPSVVAETRLLSNGSRLEIPAFHGGENGVSLVYGQAGRRLFSNRDREIAEALVAIASRVGSVRRARETGARLERARIQRDLHDDVGGRLLTLVHGSQDERQQELARKALGALREVTNALDEDQRYTLAELIDRWRMELDQRLDLADIDLDWREQGIDESVLLTSRYFINLLRTLDEAVTNALRHADTKTLRVILHGSANQLRISLCNDGLSAGTPEQLVPGRGLNNMRTRLAEIDGTFDASPRRLGDTLWFCVEACVPLQSLSSLGRGAEA